MQKFSTSPHEMVFSAWRNRSLISSLVKREVVGRYQGSIMGLAWSFFNPLLMLIIYTFVFAGVFKARWNTGNVQESKSDFAIVLFVGMIVHGLFAECVNRAPNLILSNVNYVKKVIFPLEILPWVAFGSALFHSTISFLVLLLAQLYLHQQIPWTVIFFPFILLPLVFATLGFSWFISALGVYVRDIGQITGILTTILMFISPVFYPMSAFGKYQAILKYNPLAFLIDEGRNTMIFGHVPDIFRWLMTLLLSLAIAWAGFIWFQKTRKGFADVL
jgi:lipopolysaccharide transport system permease protein